MKFCIYNYDLTKEGKNWCVTLWIPCVGPECSYKDSPIDQTKIREQARQEEAARS